MITWMEIIAIVVLTTMAYYAVNDGIWEDYEE